MVGCLVCSVVGLVGWMVGCLVCSVVGLPKARPWLLLVLLSPPPLLPPQVLLPCHLCHHLSCLSLPPSSSFPSLPPPCVLSHQPHPSFSSLLPWLLQMSLWRVLLLPQCRLLPKCCQR